MKCKPTAMLSCALLGLLLPGCDKPAPEGPSVGTNSNWLRACDSLEQCDEEITACTCGACTVPCSSDDECAALPEARCATPADPAAAAVCGPAGTATGLCLPRCMPGTCEAEQACVAGACVLAALPEVPLCAALPAREAAERTRAEELLALIEMLREQGGVSCGDELPSMPAPSLRFDARLVCAARALADDLARTRAPGVTDSQGRTTQDRMEAAGYAPRMWGDSYAIEARSAAHALELILSDPGSCGRLLSADYADVGVGGAGDVLVVTIGRE